MILSNGAMEVLHAAYQTNRSSGRFAFLLKQFACSSLNIIEWSLRVLKLLAFRLMCVAQMVTYLDPRKGAFV